MQVQDRGNKSIEQRAYELWECAGRPEGRALEYWLQAESEFTSQKPARSRAKRPTASTAGTAGTTPRTRRTTKVTPIEKGKASTRK